MRRHYVLTLAVLLSSAPLAATQTTYNWVGTGIGSWDTAGNWSEDSGYPGQTSGAGDIANFSTGSSVVPNLDIDFAYLNSITFNTAEITGITDDPSTSIVFQGFTGIGPTVTMSTGSTANISIFPPLTLEASLTITQNDNSHSLTLGSFTESGGSFGIAIDGSGTTVFSGTSTYSGSTTISGSSTLQAVHPSGSSAFSPNSDFVVSGTLDLKGNDNSINSLGGSGTVESTVGAAVLTITNGGVFSGAINDGTGPLGISLTGGTLELDPSGATTYGYTGETTLSNSAILQIDTNVQGLGSSNINLQDSSQLYMSSVVTGSPSLTINSLTGEIDTIVNINSPDWLLTIDSGGTFNGIIEGAGSLQLNGGTLALSNSNTYAAGTAVTNDGILQLTGVGQISSTGTLVLENTATLDIQAINSTAIIGILSGSTDTSVLLGSKKLIVNGSSSFAGAISGTGGSLEVNTGSLTLSGTNNTYTGATTISSGAHLIAGAGSVSTQAFAPNSDYTVGGTLSLVTFNNTINTLAGTGLVSLGTGTLTVSDGGTFSGNITGSTGGLTLSNGIFTLLGSGLYSGSTTINSGATLAFGTGGSIFSATAVTANGTFDISGQSDTSQTISNLSGSGTGVVHLGANTLIVDGTSSTSFSGIITGTGGLTYDGPTFTLTLGGTGSNYSGTTTVTAGTLQAGINNAFSPLSDYVINGTLSLNGHANTLAGLSGSGTVTTGGTGGIMTLTGGGTFSGGITGTGGVTLTGGTLDLTNASAANTYSGATLVSGASTILEYGANSALSSSSAITLSSGATLMNAGAFSTSVGSLSGDSTTFANIGTGGTLSVGNGGTFAGVISGAGGGECRSKTAHCHYQT